MASSSHIRRSKRKRSTHHQHQSSAIQIQLENATESPNGISKILHIVQSVASNDDIVELNRNNWTPLVGAIFRLAKNTTRNGNSDESVEQLLQLIRVCHERGILVNSGALFGEHYHRPLIVAAYYGYHSAVRLLIEMGALPDLGDGEGRSVWFAALQNPMASGATHRLRECDRQTAQILLDMNVVTNDLGLWRRASPKGSICYMNCDSSIGSVMVRAIQNKNTSVVKFLVNAGGCITDRDYLILSTKHKDVSPKLLRMVMEVNNVTVKAAKSWTEQIDWSFPPIWKVTVKLCQNCGMPSDIFHSYVVPFLSRNWFYPNDKCLPPLLGPSLGEKVGLCRQQRWMN